jgi:hypothetical protein
MNRNLLAVEVHGMQGLGLTKTEAKAHALERITAAMQGSYVPTMLLFPCQITAVIYRTPLAWGYILTSHDPAYPGNCHDQGYPTREVAERSCRIQVAQWLVGRTEDDGLSALLEDQDHYSHARYIGFQRACAFYKAQGMSDQECHWQACQHEEDFLPTCVA